jgi:cobalt-zinc-cadmium efflux system outer membrane protein
MMATHSYEQQLKELGTNPPQLLPQLREAARLADDNYRLGALPIATYTDMQSQSLDAIDAVLSSRLEALQNLTELEFLSGERLHDLGAPAGERNPSGGETR